MGHRLRGQGSETVFGGVPGILLRAGERRVGQPCVVPIPAATADGLSRGERGRSRQGIDAMIKFVIPKRVLCARNLLFPAPNDSRFLAPLGMTIQKNGK